MDKMFKTIPPLIYGTAWKKECTVELVEKAIILGFLGVDTACQPKHYNEAGVGQAIDRLKAQGISREMLFIQTKFTPLPGQDPNQLPYDPNASLQTQVDQSFQASLKNLGVDYVDALLLHSPLSQHEQTMVVWHEMEKLQQRGVVHRIGISNCYELESLKKIYDDAAVKPSILQNRFYKESDYDKNLRKYCREKNINYQSFWTLTANPHILQHPTLQNLASVRNVTEAQVLFRFLTQSHIIPLIGSCSTKHLQEDLAVFNFTLTDDELSKIDELL